AREVCGPSAPKGIQRLTQQRQRIVRSPLQQESAGLEYQAGDVPPQETLFGGYAELFVTGRLGLRAEPAVLIEQSREAVGVSQGERLAERVRQLSHLAIDREGLVGVAQVPQGQREEAAMGNPRILAGVLGPELRPRPVIVLRQRSSVAGTGTCEIPAIKPSR